MCWLTGVSVAQRRLGISERVLCVEVVSAACAALPVGFRLPFVRVDCIPNHFTGERFP